MTRRAVTAVTAALVGLLALAGTLVPTTAQWSDQVHALADANAGTWTSPSDSGPLEPGTNTVLGPVTWTIPSASNSGQYCFTATVSGAGTAQPWSVIVHLDQAPFWGTAASDFYYQGPVQVIVQPIDATTARIVGVGTGDRWHPDYSNSRLTSSQSVTFTLCDGHPNPAPPADPSWYTTTTTVPTAWQPTLACVQVQVSATHDDPDLPFWFGWTTTINLAAAKQHILDSGRTVNYLQWTPDPESGHLFSHSPAATNPVADSYTLTSGQIGSIRRGQPVTITACVHGY